MKSTRDQILQTLLTNPHSTINDLATAVGINAISVRHHLTSLQAEGLVVGEEERHGVGRPRLVYSLTEKGLERFPTRYLSLTNRLLDQLKETMPPAMVNGLLTQIANRIASTYTEKMHSLSLEGKLDMLKTLLAQEGYSLEWEKDGDQILIHEITCPYYHIGQAHPEICTVDQALITNMLSTPVQKINCLLNGDSHCTYIIPLPASEKNI